MNLKKRIAETYHTDIDSVNSEDEQQSQANNSKPPLAKRKSKNTFPIENYYKKIMSKENVLICIECESIDPNNCVINHSKCLKDLFFFKKLFFNLGNFIPSQFRFKLEITFV